MGGPITHRAHHSPRKTRVARRLGRAMKHAERALCRGRRARPLAGLKFRRQDAMGRHVVELVSHERRVIVELDSGRHAETGDGVAARTASLIAYRHRVLRF